MGTKRRVDREGADRLHVDESAPDRACHRGREIVSVSGGSVTLPPQPVAASAVLALQRTAGNRAVVGLLDRATTANAEHLSATAAASIFPRSRPVAVQRLLATEDLVRTISSLPGMEATLGKPLRQGPTVEERIRAVLERYSSAFENTGGTGDHDAMKIVGAITQVAAEIAREQNAPRLRPLIARELIRTNKGQLAQMVKGSGDKDDSGAAESTIRLATVLAGDDPVGLYLQHEKISFSDCVWRIRVMAAHAKRKPSEVFEMLSRQYQVALGSLNQAQVQKGQRGKEQFPGGSFDFADIYGEVSRTYFEEVFQVHEGNVKWKPGGAELQEGTEQKLQSLSDAVKEFDGESGDADIKDVSVPEPLKTGEGEKPKKPTGEEEAPPLPDTLPPTDLREQIRGAKPPSKRAGLLPPGMAPLTEQQYAYLRKLSGGETERAEGGTSAIEDADTKVLLYFREKVNVDPDNAAAMLQTCVNTLATASLTITFKAEDLFKQAGTVGDTYRQFFDVFKETVDLPGGDAKATRVSRMCSIGDRTTAPGGGRRTSEP
jgi:hypothetical protein